MQKRYSNIQDIVSLFRAASDFHARLQRMAPKENGETIADPENLGALADAAHKLEVISPFSYSASGVVFLQKKDEILSGERPLKHVEAQAAAGYIARQARKACGF